MSGGNPGLSTNVIVFFINSKDRQTDTHTHQKKEERERRREEREGRRKGREEGQTGEKLGGAAKSFLTLF